MTGDLDDSRLSWFVKFIASAASDEAPGDGRPHDRPLASHAVDGGIRGDVDLGDSPSDHVWELAHRLIGDWHSGRGRPVGESLNQHPQLADDRSLLLDLAYEEFCARREQGESIGTKSFCARVPIVGSSLRRLIALERQFGPSLDKCVDELLDDNTVPWPEPGQTWCGFPIIEELGRGGLGRVYLGRQPDVGERLVVLKLTSRDMAEARTLGRLQHDNVMPAYSRHADLSTGLTAICMPFLGRATLAHVRNAAFRGSRPPRNAGAIVRAARADWPKYAPAPSMRVPEWLGPRSDYVTAIVTIGRQLAAALAYTHGQGVLHRDLKPSNVLVTPQGRALLLDFNLAHDMREPRRPGGGTLPYMAPEELDCLLDPRRETTPPDPRSDIYSLGALLFELLVGRPPYSVRGGASSDRLDQVRRLREQQRAGLPPDLMSEDWPHGRPLASLLADCLAERLDDRPATAGELARKLYAVAESDRRWFEECSAQQDSVASPSTSDVGKVAAEEKPNDAARRRLRWSARAAAVIAVSTAAGWLLVVAALFPSLGMPDHASLLAPSTLYGSRDVDVAARPDDSGVPAGMNGSRDRQRVAADRGARLFVGPLVDSSAAPPSTRFGGGTAPSPDAFLAADSRASSLRLILNDQPALAVRELSSALRSLRGDDLTEARLHFARGQAFRRLARQLRLEHPLLWEAARDDFDAARQLGGLVAFRAAMDGRRPDSSSLTVAARDPRAGEAITLELPVGFTSLSALVDSASARRTARIGAFLALFEVLP